MAVAAKAQAKFSRSGTLSSLSDGTPARVARASRAPVSGSGPSACGVSRRGTDKQGVRSQIIATWTGPSTEIHVVAHSAWIPVQRVDIRRAVVREDVVLPIHGRGHHRPDYYASVVAIEGVVESMDVVH